MKASDFDEIILDALAQDALVYGGFSAGMVVLTPLLHGIELVGVGDDPNTIPAGYDALWRRRAERGRGGLIFLHPHQGRPFRKITQVDYQTHPMIWLLV